MKKFLKISFFSIITIAVLIGGWFVYNKYFADKNNKDAMMIIPNNAIFVVETSNLTKAWTEISDSKVWSFLIQNPYFKDVNQDIEMLNTFLKRNKAVDLLLNNRQLLMSAHMTSAKDWDFFFVVDLTDIPDLDDVIKNALSFVDGYVVKESNYKGEQIIQLVNNKNPNDVIYLSTVDNLLLTTFTGTLMETAIDQKNDEHWKKNKYFSQVNDNLSNKQLFKFYFNYSQLDKFSKVFLSEETETIKMLGSSLGFSALNINLENELLSFDGYTNTDSVGSYVKALAGVAPGKMKAYEIISDQAALYFSMGFEDFYDFYANLISQYEAANKADMDDIEENVKLLETFLGISVETNFFDWIGNEIAFVKLRPGLKTRVEDVVVAIHAKDIDKAKEGWGKIIDRIGKRTVVKFEKENYKNFEIRILERRGFFKLFFGKMFDKLEKPYFTYIEDYVVFSNSLDALKTIVDDYVTGSTLSHNKNFMDFKDNFSQKTNLSIFIQSPKMYQNLYHFSLPEEQKSIHNNKDFILSFALIGFQMNSKDGMFETKLIAKHDPDATGADELEKFEKEASDDLFRAEFDSLKFKIVMPTDSLKADKSYKSYYEETTNIQNEGIIKANNLNGIWRTYYISGNLKSSVNYVNGKVDGEAVFYYDDPKKNRKAQIVFKEDQIINDYMEFHPNGAQKVKIEYEDGQPNGDAEFYYESGRLKIEAKFKKGEKAGKWKYYEENGDLKEVEKWKKGKKK